MRVIAHTCSNTEIVCALGRADWLVGVDEHSDYPVDVVSRLPKIGPDLDIDINKIIDLKPDLVITSLTVPGHERCLQRIQESGIPHLVTQPHSLKEIQSDIQRIGHALAAESRAQALVERFDHYREAPAFSSTIPILIEWWPKPVIVPGRKSWVNEMLELAGAHNPWRNDDSESLEITDEQACAAAPEAIIMSWCGVKEANYRPHIVERRTGWASIPAIRNQQIIPISEAWLGRPGPRVLQGIEKLRSVVNACMKR